MKVTWRDKAKNVAASLKAEYESGKQGDESPAAPIWATPQQQFNGLLAVLRQTAVRDGSITPNDEVDEHSQHSEHEGANEHDVSGGPGADQTAHTAVVGTGSSIGDPESTPDPVQTDADVAEVAAALRGVDWAGVRAATAERTAEATKAMRSMADHVDWGKVQPVAAKVSSALIAAIATGQLGIGGRLATTVARTITNQNGMGQRVAEELEVHPSDQPIDFRSTIEAASRES